MFFNFLPLTVVFQLSIFALLCYKLYGLTKTVLLPFLNEQLLLEKKQQIELLNKEKLLFSSQQRLKNQILSQKQLFILLERNAQVWTLAEQEKKQAQEKENKDIVLQTQERRRLQSHQLQLLNNAHNSLPIAHEQATNHLAKFYATDAGKELLIHLIDALAYTTLHSHGKKG